MIFSFLQALPDISEVSSEPGDSPDDDNLPLIIGLAVGIPLALLLLAILAYMFCWYGHIDCLRTLFKGEAQDKMESFRTATGGGGASLCPNGAPARWGRV
jgi:hypothetical protein